MSKKVFYDDDARQRVLGGAKALYDAVKTTLGPKGRNVIIGRSYGNPTVTKDGVTVAKSVELPEVDDETLGYKVGADLIKQAASKLNDKAGDGTTTVTVLTYHILSEANKLIAAGHDPMQLRKGIEAAAEQALESLNELSEDIKDNQQRITEVATISASDPEIGKLITDVMAEIGENGTVTVEAGQGLKLEKEVVDGYVFDRGFVSSYMVTDQSRMEAVYENPMVLITDKKLGGLQEILPLLENMAAKGMKNLLIIADDIEGEVLGTLILNKLKGVFNVVAVKAPSFGEQKTLLLEDIACFTGGTFVSNELGGTLEDTAVLGTAQKVIVTKDTTTIVGSGGDKVKERISSITSQAKTAKSDYDKENFQKRAASLGCSVAVIKVGGASETEIEEKKFRVDDAVAAVKAALADGIVAGGGVTLLNLADNIGSLDDDSSLTAGRTLLKEALSQPFKTLLQNSGIDPGRWLFNMSDKSGMGIDVLQAGAGLIDMKAAGIIDPTRVTREVISSAVSVAGTAMTMGALVVDIPEKESQPQMPMM